MSIEQEALQALADGVLAESFIRSMNWMWFVIGLGIPMIAMVIYKYFLVSLADRILLFLSNKPWTDKGKLVQLNGERWVIKELGLFRAYFWKASVVRNRGKSEYMKKTLTLAISKYINSDIIYYEYPELYSEEEFKHASFDQIKKLFEKIEELEKKGLDLSEK